MSLLLDALQRASRDKEKAAAGKAAAEGEIRLRGTKPGDPAFPDLAPSVPAAPPPEEPALELMHDAAPAALNAPSEPAPTEPEPAPHWEMVDAMPPPAAAVQAPPDPTPVQPAEVPVTRAASPVQVAQDIRRAHGQEAARPAKGRRRILLLGAVAAALLLGLGALFWLGQDDSAVRLAAPAAPSAPVAAPTPVPGAEPAAVAPSAGAPLGASAQMPPQAAVPARAPAAAPLQAVAKASLPGTAPASSVPPAAASAAAVTAAVPAPAKASAPAHLPGHEVVLRGAAPKTMPQAALETRTRGPSAMEAAYAALMEGKLDEAARLYAQALGPNPQERDALLGLGYIAQQKGLRDEAQGYYRRVLRQEPGNTIANAALLALDAEVNANPSSRSARELAARQPDSALALSTAGHALVREGSIADAAQYFARAQVLEPANALHAYNHAVALDRLGQSAQAAVQYQRVLNLAEKAPTHTVSSFSLDAVRQRLEQLRQALTPRSEAAP